MTPPGRLPATLLTLLAQARAQHVTITPTARNGLVISGDGTARRVLAGHYAILRDWLSRHPGQCARCGQPPGTGHLICPGCAPEAASPGDQIPGYGEALAAACPTRACLRPVQDRHDHRTQRQIRLPRDSCPDVRELPLRVLGPPGQILMLLRD